VCAQTRPAFTLSLDLNPGHALCGAAQSAFDTIAIIVLVPVYDRLLAPLLRWTYLQRIGWGQVVRLPGLPRQSRPRPVTQALALCEGAEQDTVLASNVCRSCQAKLESWLQQSFALARRHHLWPVLYT
jgi:hypothetical protein